MPDPKQYGHPFIPNSAPEARARALAEIGINSVEDIYAVIPPELRFKGKLDLPAPLFVRGRSTEACCRNNRKEQKHI